MRQAHMCVLVVVLALAGLSPAPAGAQETSLEPAALAAPAFAVEPLAVPDWLAWKVLYDSLTFYRGQSPAAVEAMLQERTGLAPAQAPALVAAGDAYLAVLAEIEAEARATVQAQFGRARPQAPGKAPPPGDGRTALVVERGTPVYDLARASGLVDEIEGRKQAALAAHRAALLAALGEPTVTRLTELVATTVAPAITRTVLRPAPPPDPATSTPDTLDGAAPASGADTLD